MKKASGLLLIMALYMLCLQSTAQTLGVKAGLNMAKFLDYDNDNTYSSDYLWNPGFHFGITLDIPLTKVSSFESGLFCTTRGARYKSEGTATTFTSKADIYYLQIPLTFKARTNNEGKVHAFCAIGPYLGIGLSGSILAEAEYHGESDFVVVDIIWGSNKYNNHLKRLELGFSLGGGVELGSLSLGASYDIGLNNISAYQDNGATIKHRVLKFSLGYSFGKYYVK